MNKVCIEKGNFKFLLRSAAALLIAVFVGLFATAANGQNVEVLKVGRFWTEQTDDGALGPVFFSSGWWPADFNVTANETHTGSAATGIIYLLTTNWAVPDGWLETDGVVYGKVVCGLQSPFNSAGTIIEPQTSYVRYGYPSNEVEGEQYQGDEIGTVDPSKMVGSCDQVVEVTNKFAIGVEARRRVYAWSQQNHDDYVVNDITLTNVSDKILTDFHVSISTGFNDFEQAWGENPEPAGLEHNHRWAHYYGTAPTDSQRVFYTYHADEPRVSGDNMASPALDQEGRLIRPSMHFYGFLHVSQPYTVPADDVDDPLQPRITFRAYAPYLGIPEPRSRYGVSIDNATWYDPVAGGAAIPADPEAPAGTLHQLGSDELGDPDFTAIGQGVGYTGPAHNEFSTIGPYAFTPGESIHIIYVVGTAGISLKKAVEVGKKMLAGTLEDPPNLPDPVTGYFPSNFAFPVEATEQDIIKDRWFSTGIDSVHKTMYHAQWNFEHDWNVPGAPPPPSMEIQGFADNATITWSDTEAEELDNFAGYRIMRRKSMLDTAFFQVVHTTGPEDKAAEHQFEDTGVMFGASYTYYVQAAILVDENDLDALPSQRGKKLWSGRVFLPTPKSIEPPRGGTETLDDIIIAPNPYNINDPLVQAQGWTDFRGILFFNLPAYCEINIYTEDGDHVREIIHDSPVRAGSLHWDMITESDQVISSGVYIATFTDKNGNVAFRKFLVAR